MHRNFARLLLLTPVHRNFARSSRLLSSQPPKPTAELTASEAVETANTPEDDTAEDEDDTAEDEDAEGYDVAPEESDSVERKASVDYQPYVKALNEEELCIYDFLNPPEQRKAEADREALRQELEKIPVDDPNFLESFEEYKWKRPNYGESFPVNQHSMRMGQFDLAQPVSPEDESLSDLELKDKYFSPEILGTVVRDSEGPYKYGFPIQISHWEWDGQPSPERRNTVALSKVHLRCKISDIRMTPAQEYIFREMVGPRAQRDDFTLVVHEMPTAQDNVIRAWHLLKGFVKESERLAQEIFPNGLPDIPKRVHKPDLLAES